MNSLLVILAVAGAVAYCLWHALGRKRKGGGGGCGGGCDCTVDRKEQ